MVIYKLYTYSYDEFEQDHHATPVVGIDDSYLLRLKAENDDVALVVADSVVEGCKQLGNICCWELVRDDYTNGHPPAIGGHVEKHD